MKLPLFTLGALLWALPGTSQIVINEIMQSNIDCVMDDLNQFPDSWIELYNAGTTNVTLNKYRIGIEDDFSSAFMISGKTLVPGGFCLVYCDKEAKGWHTDFRLESGKNGAVYLYDESGKVIDKIESLPKMAAPNVSYARTSDGGDSWSFMVSATPNARNSSSVASDVVLPAPVFSLKGGCYSKPQLLTISLPEDAPQGAYIRYTKDGSEPLASSLDASAGQISINSTTVIRAKVFADNAISIPSTAHSYIFHNRDVTLPVVSILTNRKYLYDSKLGIYTDGSYSSSTKNYDYDWRRPVNFEYFADAESEAALNQLCETRISGGASRGAEMKSLAMYANKRFGEKRFDYPLFSDKPEIKIKSFLLRNSGNDFCYSHFRDAAIQLMFSKNVDIDWQAYQPAIIYINGKYMGIENLRERSNEDNIYSNYDGLEDIDMFENWWELKSGDWDAFNSFKDLYSDFSVPYESLVKVMDIDEFINLIVLDTYHANRDFPGNNIVMWRPRTEDGRWRWIVKDTDFGLGLYGQTPEFKYLDFMLRTGEYVNGGNGEWGNSESGTMLVRNLMKKEEFKNLFIDRFAIYMGDFLNSDYGGEVIDSLQSNIKYEYPYHKNTYPSFSWKNWYQEVADMKTWMGNRTPFMYSYLKSYFNLQNAVNLTVNNSETRVSDSDIFFNGHRLSHGRFQGKFFAGRQMQLSCESADQDKMVSGWDVTSVKAGVSSTEFYKGAELLLALSADMSQVSIDPVLVSTFIAELSSADSVIVTVENGEIVCRNISSGSNIEIFNLSGVKLSQQIAEQSVEKIQIESSGILVVRISGEGGVVSHKVIK